MIAQKEDEISIRIPESGKQRTKPTFRIPGLFRKSQNRITVFSLPVRDVFSAGSASSQPHQDTNRKIQ